MAIKSKLAGLYPYGTGPLRKPTLQGDAKTENQPKVKKVKPLNVKMVRLKGLLK